MAWALIVLKRRACHLDALTNRGWSSNQAWQRFVKDLAHCMNLDILQSSLDNPCCIRLDLPRYKFCHRILSGDLFVSIVSYHCNLSIALTNVGHIHSLPNTPSALSPDRISMATLRP